MRLAIYLSQGARVMVSTALSTVKVFWARESLSASWNVIGFYGALKLRNSIDAVI